MYIRACRERALGVLNAAGFNLIGFLDSFEKKHDPDEDDDEHDRDDDDAAVHHDKHHHDAPPEEVHVVAAAAVTTAATAVAQQPLPASTAPIFPCALKYGHGSRRNHGESKKNPASKALIASLHAPIMGNDTGGGGGGKQKK
jgi:hypothetical protein